MIFDASTTEILQKIQNNPEQYLAYWHVQMDDLVPNLSETGSVSFSLPELQEVEFEPIQIDEHSQHGDLIWSGKSSSDNSYMVFLRNQSQKAAFIKHGRFGYQVVQANSGQHILVKTKSDIMAGCGNVPHATPPPDITPTAPDFCPEDDYNTCAAVIKVLFLITQADLANFTSLFPISFYTGIQEGLTNAIFVNSDIPQKKVRISWQAIPSFNFSTDLSLSNYERAVKDITELEINQNIMVLRDQANADLVFLLSNGATYTMPGSGTILGLANAPLDPDPDKAFGIFVFGAPFEVLVFQHELGHTFGCRHNSIHTYGDDDTPICWHAKRHFIETDEEEGYSWGTVVRRPIPVPDVYVVVLNDNDDTEIYFVDYDEVIPHYSNPDVFYQGVPTGNHDDVAIIPPAANNARRIRDVGCDVAQYRGGQDLQLSISQSAPCLNTWTGVITAPGIGGFGQPPYSFEWRTSLSGVFSGQSSNVVGADISVSLNILPDCVFWLQCKVTSSDGMTIHQTVQVDARPCGCIPVRSAKKASLSKSHDFDFFVSPNPVDFQNSILKIESNEKSLYVKVLQSDGKLVSEQNIVLPTGIASLGISGFQPGVYFVQAITHDGKSATQILVIQ